MSTVATKRALGKLYDDKQFLEKLMKDEGSVLFFHPLSVAVVVVSNVNCFSPSIRSSKCLFKTQLLLHSHPC